MENTRLLLLIDRALNDTLTVAERDELHRLLADHPESVAVKGALQKRWESLDPQVAVFSKEQGNQMLERIFENVRDISAKKSRIKRLFPWLKMVAAAFLAAITWIAIYLYPSDGAPVSNLELAVERAGIRPGADKAVVVMADGKMVELDQPDAMLLAKGGRMYLSHPNDNGTADEPLSDEISGYHTVKIPKGGHYHVRLEDGTSVHLNAESSLRFPIRFSTERREVELTGEGYFEVVRDVARPFVVNTPQQTIRVLGTAFNVCAYSGQGNMKTTLVNGAVEVTHDDRTVPLRPGQAAVSTHEQHTLYVTTVDINKELAWHHDYFVFDNEDIRSIMERVGRWYDIDVAFKGKVDNIRLGGVFQRSKSISQLLKSFEATGLLVFKIEGRRITVIEKNSD